MIVELLDKRLSCAGRGVSTIFVVSVSVQRDLPRLARRRMYADSSAAEMGSVKILKTLGVGKVCSIDNSIPMITKKHRAP